jgi:predicted deacylase
MTATCDKLGPVLWLTACGHGDEVGGIVVIQEVFKLLRRRKLLQGTIFAFPLMNPLGFETSSRNITFSMEDLNRSFPGNSNGSPAERIADKIFTHITQTEPDLVVDLHNDWINSIPYTLIDRSSDILKRAAVYGKTKAYGEKTGFLVILDTDDMRRTLSYCLMQRDIPALTLELGESYIVNEENIAYGVKSILNILSCLGMIDPGDFFQYPLPEICRGKILRYLDKPLSSSSGIIRFFSKPGDLVRRGQPVAKIYNAFGKLLETITVLNDGIVLGHTDSSVAFPGIPIMTFGIY